MHTRIYTHAMPNYTLKPWYHHPSGVNRSAKVSPTTFYVSPLHLCFWWLLCQTSQMEERLEEKQKLVLDLQKKSKVLFVPIIRHLFLSSCADPFFCALLLPSPSPLMPHHVLTGNLINKCRNWRMR